MDQAAQPIEVLMVGSRGVGKSKLIDRLMHKPFTHSYTPTLHQQNQSTVTYNLELESSIFELHITEMNKIPFKLFDASPFPQYDYIIFVYDLSKSSTWHDLKKYKEQIEKYFDPANPPKCYTIGNKADKQTMDTSKLTFFSSHFEISAMDESVDEKKACMQIWNNAYPLKYPTQKPLAKPDPLPEDYIEWPFQVSIPTSLARISGTFNADGMIKTILVGSQMVGKSAITALINGEQIPAQYVTTIGLDFRNLNIRCQDRKFKVQIWDTAGMEKFRPITACYYRNMNVSCYVYDITNPLSFHKIKELHADITASNNSKPVFSILLANKSDLQSQRKISFEEGAALAEELKMKFFEVSAKNRQGVLEAFLSGLQEFILQKND